MKFGYCLLLLSLFISGVVFADTVSVCYGYGCKKTQSVIVSEQERQEINQYFSEVEDAASERVAIGYAVQKLYLIAGKQTPIYQDKGGNFKDGPNEGKMDCVDHSETDTYFLKYLVKHQLIQLHTVVKPYYRAPIFFNLHYASRIEEKETKQQWVVDSWFYDFGALPVVMDAEQWRKGWYPEGW